MKKQICVSVDTEAWIIAKQKLNNVSEYLSECLRNVAGSNKTELQEEEIQQQINNINEVIQTNNIKKSILEMDLKLVKEQVEELKKQRLETERYKRWKCPVCRIETLNLMENDRCKSCNLPTRGSPKTIIVTLDKLEDDSNEVRSL